jgi:hypothetical protein
MRPLRRLKVSRVWQHLHRDSDTAVAMHSLAELHRSTGNEELAAGYEGIATKLEVNPEHIWFSNLSLELGALERTYDGTTLRRGEASLHFGQWWRVESPRAIVVSTKTDQRQIEEELKLFAGRRALDVQVTGRLPEMIVCFSGRRWIQSFGHYGNPSWHIALPDSSSVSSRSGRLIRTTL